MRTQGRVAAVRPLRMTRVPREPPRPHLRGSVLPTRPSATPAVGVCAKDNPVASGTPGTVAETRTSAHRAAPKDVGRIRSTRPRSHLVDRGYGALCPEETAGRNDAQVEMGQAPD